ncbi:MAG: hypothetical protein Tsb0020_27020 [Haliangiales bacterium]
MACAALCGQRGPAWAQAQVGAGEPEAGAVSSASHINISVALDLALAYGFADDAWERSYGGEISLSRRQPSASLALIGVGLGGTRATRADVTRVWRLWLDVAAATRTRGLLWGIAAGPGVELSPIRRARWRGHATVWIFAGVAPYVRAGVIQEGGIFTELGVQVVLPAIDW